MSPAFYIIGGLVLMAIGTGSVRYGWYKLSNDNTEVIGAITESSDEVKDVVKESTEEIKATTEDIQVKLDRLDQAVLAINNKLTVPTKYNDPGFQDGGKILATVKWSTGPIIDIGNPGDLSKNRLSISFTSPNQILLTLFDSNGKQYLLQGRFDLYNNGMVKLECLWSSRDNVIAILVNGQILSKVQISDLTIFQDTAAVRQARIGSNFEGEQGNGIIREVFYYIAKEL